MPAYTWEGGRCFRRFPCNYSARFCFSREGITFGDPFRRFLQPLNEPCGSSFLFPQTLPNASIRRVFGKTNDPAGGGIHLMIAERGGLPAVIPDRSPINHITPDEQMLIRYLYFQSSLIPASRSHSALKYKTLPPCSGRE